MKGKKKEGFRFATNCCPDSLEHEIIQFYSRKGERWKAKAKVEVKEKVKAGGLRQKKSKFKCQMTKVEVKVEGLEAGDDMRNDKE